MASSRAARSHRGFVNDAFSVGASCSRRGQISQYPAQQPITNPCFSHDKSRPRRIIRQFLPQMPHHNPQIMAVLGMCRPPDILEQLLLGDHSPRMPRQLRQHRVFLAGQRHFDAVEQHPPIGQIHRQRTETQCRQLGLPRRCLTQQGANPSEELLNAERLGHVVIGAAIQCLDFLPFAGAHRQHQYRRRGPLAKLAQHLLAVHVRQAEVEHQQVRLVQRRLRQVPRRRCRPQALCSLGKRG
jgi:hypothetical protein